MKKGKQTTDPYLFAGFAQYVTFCLGHGVEVLYPFDSAISCDGIREELFELSCLTVIIYDTFLYIGVLPPELVMYLSLGYLWIECEQVVDESLYAVKPFLRCGEVKQFVDREYSAPWNTIFRLWSTSIYP